MANFLRMLGQNSNRPEKIVFWNGGVRLLCEGSQVLEHVKKLENRGVEILACTTCLEYFDLEAKLQVGRPTTMAGSVKKMMSSDVVCL
jgi:intracellular sulfur oxidation DsrE/DsrF family protein